MLKSVKILSIYILLLVCNLSQAQLHNLRHFTFVDAKDELYEAYDPEDTIFETVTIMASREIEPFYMMIYENSGYNFEIFCKETGYQMPEQPPANNPLMPIVNVTYLDAMAYCKWLSEYYGITFRLPTDKEWEHAASAGFRDESVDENGISSDIIYIKNAKYEKSNCITCGQPNLNGLYNMRGNVWEITIPSDSDPNISENTINIMGGSFFEDADHVNSNTKLNHNKNFKRADVGFRIVASKSDYELLLFIDKAEVLLTRIKSIEEKIKITGKGISLDTLFVEWRNGFETFYYNEKKGTAGFCCWVQDINNLGPESKKDFTFKFKKEELNLIKEIAEHFNQFPFEE